MWWKLLACLGVCEGGVKGKMSPQYRPADLGTGGQGFKRQEGRASLKGSLMEEAEVIQA